MRIEYGIDVPISAIDRRIGCSLILANWIFQVLCGGLAILANKFWNDKRLKTALWYSTYDIYDIAGANWQRPHKSRVSITLFLSTVCLYLNFSTFLFIGLLLTASNSYHTMPSQVSFRPGCEIVCKPLANLGICFWNIYTSLIDWCVQKKRDAMNECCGGFVYERHIKPSLSVIRIITTSFHISSWLCALFYIKLHIGTKQGVYMYIWIV